MPDWSRAEPEDEEVVRRVQQGDIESFALLFERHHRRLAGFLRQMGVPEAEAEDLVGETFCRALDRIEQYDLRRGRRYLSYLYAIARNLVTDWSRRHRRVQSLDDLGDCWEVADGLDEERVVAEIYEVEQAALIREAMRRLNTADREILLLAYERELSSREIMELTGKPTISAVTTHVYKAMKKLRGHVAAMARETEARRP